MIDSSIIFDIFCVEVAQFSYVTDPPPPAIGHRVQQIAKVSCPLLSIALGNCGEVENTKFTKMRQVCFER